MLGRLHQSPPKLLFSGWHQDSLLSPIVPIVERFEPRIFNYSRAAHSNLLTQLSIESTPLILYRDCSENLHTQVYLEISDST